MKLLTASIVGVIAGLIGASIWAAIAYFAHFEIGWIAWIIGGLVGFGVALGAKGETGMDTGILAVVIAVASICGGKWAAIHFEVSKSLGEVQSQVTVSNDDAMLFMAHDLVKEYESGGKAMKWPEGYSKDSAEDKDHFPKELWKDVTKRWQSMSATEQASYRDAIQNNIKASMASFASAIESEGFFQSFGLLDLLFFGLAVVTAFKIGTGMAGDGD